MGMDGIIIIFACLRIHLSSEFLVDNTVMDIIPTDIKTTA